MTTAVGIQYKEGVAVPFLNIESPTGAVERHFAEKLAARISDLLAIIIHTEPPLNYVGELISLRPTGCPGICT